MMAVGRLPTYKMVEVGGQGIVPFASSLLTKAIDLLRIKGGSLWVASPDYTFTNSDGTGAAGDSSDAGYVRDLCASYGPELVGAAWAGIFGGVPSLVGGTLTVTATGASPYAGASQAIALQAGRTYQASYEVVDASQSDGVYLIVGSDSATAPPRSLTLGPHTTAGTYTAIFTAQADAAGYLSVSAGNGGMAAGETIAFRNISVREIIGRPLTQATTSFKPKLRLVGGRWAWVFDGVDDALYSSATTGASGTLIAAFATSRLAWQSVLGTGGVQTSYPGVSLGLTHVGEFSMLSGNATIANSRYITTSAVSVSKADVVTAKWQNSAPQVVLRRNGVVQSNRMTNYQTQSASSSGIFLGKLDPNWATDRFSGNVFAAAYCPSALSDAELLIIEKAMAQLAGVTI